MESDQHSPWVGVGRVRRGGGPLPTDWSCEKGWSSLKRTAHTLRLLIPPECFCMLPFWGKGLRQCKAAPSSIHTVSSCSSPNLLCGSFQTGTPVSSTAKQGYSRTFTK